MSPEEIAKMYLVEEYLLQEPDFLSMVEWLDDQGDIVFDGDDAEIHDAAIALLDTLAQRLADDE